MLLRLKMNRTLSKTILMSHLVTVGLCRLIMPFFISITIMQYTFVNASTKHISYFSASGLTVVGWSDSQQRALREMEYFRQTTQSSSHTLLFENSITTAWGNDRQVERGEKLISPYSLAKSVARQIPRNRFSAYYDQDFMSNFLENSKLNALVHDNSLERRWILPNRASLLDFIAIDSQRIDSWVTSRENESPKHLFQDFQYNKGLSRELLQRVEVREIIVGKTHDNEIKNIAKWMKKMHLADQTQCPTNTMSMDVEEVKIHEADFKLIMDKAASSDSTPTQISKIFRKGDKCKQLPVKMMLGNGYTWALMISILVEPSLVNPRTHFEVSPISFQPRLLKLFKSLPMFVGVGIRSDVEEMEQLIRIASKPDFKFDGCIDLSALAVLCGYNFRFFNMQALSVQLLGAVMNKSVSVGDHKWGYRWEAIPDSLKVYCLGDVKFGYQVSVLLITTLLRDLFPDPDVVLSFIRSSGYEFMLWFSAWIFLSLRNVEVSPDILPTAADRSELLQALRIRMEDGSLSEAPPARVKLIGSLMGSWPTVTFGGCRFLHQARWWWWQQLRILKENNPGDWDSLMMPYPVTDEMREAATYGIPGLAALDYNRRLSSDAPLGLCLHPDIAHRTVVDLPIEDFAFEALVQKAGQFFRIKREMTYEYVRLNLSHLATFFDKIEASPYCKKYIRSYYCESRMIFQRATGQVAPRSPRLDRLLRRRDQTAVDVERRCIEELNKRLEVRQQRLSIFEARLEDDGSKVCTATWRGQVPRVTRRETGKKRSRQDFEPSDYLVAAAEEDAQDVVAFSSAWRDPHEFDHRREVSVPRAKKARRTPRVAMGQPGFCDYDLVLDLPSDEHDI